MARNIFKTDDNKYYKQIFEDYNKSKEDLEEYIEILRKWGETQLHLPEKPTYRTLRFIVLYNKFSTERAKQRLDTYYTIRTIMPELYTKDPLSDQMVLQSKITYCVPLPKVTEDFKRIIYTQFNPEYGTDVFNYDTFVAHYFNVMELMIETDNCYSFHCIFDGIGAQLGHLPKISPMTVKKASVCLEKVYSNRLMSIYFVNFAPFLEQFMNSIVKPLLHPKIRQRIKTFSGTDILLKDFGKSLMPKDVGGEESSLSELNELLLKQFEVHKARFETLQSLKVDESLRPCKLVNDNLLGYYGNFKKINVD